MSAGIGALAAQIVFWAVLFVGWAMDELSPRVVVLFVVVWIAAYIGSAYVPQGDYLFSSFVAVLDVVLVLMVFKSDISLT
jgi:hypothetical protein